MTGFIGNWFQCTVLLAMTLILTACDSSEDDPTIPEALSAAQQSSEDRESPVQERQMSGDDSSQANEERTILSNGYAQLYDGFNKMAWTDEIFLVRIESDVVDDFGSRLSEVATELSAALEALQAQEGAGWIDLEETGLPEVSLRTINSSDRDRLLSFAPFFGRDRENFERTLLLSASGGLNHLLHLTEVLLDAETDAERLNFLEGTKSRLSELYERDIEILEEIYFRQPNTRNSEDEA